MQERITFTPEVQKQIEKLVNHRLRELKQQKPLFISDISCPVRPELGNVVSLVFLRAIRLIAFRETLGHHLSAAILYQAGKRIAAQMSIGSLEELQKYLGDLMVGKTYLVEANPDHIVFEEEECGVCSGLPNIGEPVCYFEAGFIAGALSHISGRDITVLETKCWGLGDRICRFEADLSPKPVPSAQESSIFAAGCDDPIEMIAALISKAALAIELNEELERRNALLQQELLLAQEVQKRLLPRRYPPLPNLEVEVFYQPLLQVGGDFYDFVTLSQNRFGVFLSDVTGHGVHAAMITTIIKTMLNSFAPEAVHPSDFILRLDREMQNTLPGLYFSAAYVLVDPNRRTLTYTNAGHPPGILVDAQGAGCRLLEGNYGLLGVFDEATPLPVSMTLNTEYPYQPGDRLFLFTDGLYEVRNQAGNAFGYERLLQTILDHRALPLVQIRALLEKEIKAYAQEKELKDDICLVALTLP